MPQTLTAERIEADFADMATDFPCTVTFTEPDSGVSETLHGTYGTLDESAAFSDAGFLVAYRFSVWVSSSQWTTKPKPSRLVTVAITNPQSGAVTSGSHQVLRVAEDDGVVLRLDLGDPNA